MAISGAAALSPLEYPWSSTTEEVLAALGVHEETGLLDEQVQAQRAKHGFNELEKEAPTGWLELIREQFDDSLVKVGALGRSAAATAAACVYV